MRRRFGALAAREKQVELVVAVAEAPQARGLSIQPTREKFAKSLNPGPASLDSWAARPRPLSSERIKVCQCKFGVLCWPARIFAHCRPDIRARQARYSCAPGASGLPRVRIVVRARRALPRALTLLQGSDIYRVDDLAKTEEEWRQATVLRYACSSHRRAPARGDFDGRMRARGGGMQCGAMSTEGWSDAAYGDQSPEGRRRLVYVIGPCPPHLMAHAASCSRRPCLPGAGRMQPWRTGVRL